MDFGQQRLQQQDAARMMMYQNTGYQFERRDKKTLIVDVADDGTTKPLSTAGEFSVDLFEPMIIDKLCDVYLDNFTTYNSLLCDDNKRGAFSLQINEFNVNSNVASSGTGQNIFNRILIPNENNDVSDAHSAVVHKGKKMNYVCSINPGTISKITGKVTDMDGGSMFTTGDGSDGGKLYYVEIDAIGTGGAVRSGTQFTFNGASGNFKTAYYLKEGSTDLYFYSDGGVITGSTNIGGGTITETGGTGLNGRTPDDSTKRVELAVSYPRFTAEFVIVARE